MVKRVSLFVIIVSVIVTALTLMSYQSSQSSSTEFKDESSSLQIQRSTPEKSRVAELNSEDLITLKNFAESYEPKSTKQQEIPSPPMPDEKVLQAISNLASIQSREHEKYIILIFLRLHRFHIEHFKQSYDLYGNPLTKEFYRLIAESYNPNAEPKLSYLAENWVEKNPELLKYSLIEKEMTRIEKADENIKKELEQTIKEQERSR